MQHVSAVNVHTPHTNVNTVDQMHLVAPEWSPVRQAPELPAGTPVPLPLDQTSFTFTEGDTVTRSRDILAVILVLGLAGCTPYQMTLTNAERAYPPTLASNVQLFLQGETSPQATEIGEITILDDTQESGIAFLREKAAAIGADGVVGVEVQIQTRLLFVLLPIPIHSYTISGTAVRYTVLSMEAPR